MTLEEMGALLRQERENRGISLEQAATEIKISKKYLVALEEGRTQELPHPVYAKGFVKNYAKLVGLDPEEMGAVLANYYKADDDHGHVIHQKPAPQKAAPQPAPAPAPEAAPVSAAEKPAAPPRPRRPITTSSGFRPPLWLALPLFLLFVGLAWFFFFSSSGRTFSFEELRRFFPSSDVSSPAAPQAESAKPAAQKPAPAKTEPEQKPAPQAEAPSVPRDLLATGNTGKAPAPAQDSSPEQDVSPARLAAEAQFASSGNQTVEVNAGQPTRVEVTTEDGQTKTFSLVKGQRLALRFNEKATVRFLSGGSVSVKLNGKDYPLEAGKLEGRVVTFQ